MDGEPRDHFQIVACSSLMQIGISAFYLALFFVFTITIAVFQGFTNLKQLKWPTWLSFTLALLILVLRSLRSAYEYMAAVNSITSLRLDEHCINVNHLYCIWCD